MALTRNTSKQKKKGWKKRTAYGLGAVGFGAQTAYGQAKFAEILNALIAAQVNQGTRDTFSIRGTQMTPSGLKFTRGVKTGLITAGVLGGALAGRAIQHQYRKSRARHPGASRVRALGAGYAKGSLLSPFTGPAIAWRDLRAKMGKRYHPLKTL